MMSPIGVRKLRPGEIKFLSFEGGGGKGVAYLGALGVLADEQVGILKRIEKDGKDDFILDKAKIKGISGASAGAITATLLAVGYSLREIYAIVTNEELLSTFYDPPEPVMIKPDVSIRSRGANNKDITITPEISVPAVFLMPVKRHVWQSSFKDLGWWYREDWKRQLQTAKKIAYWVAKVIRLMVDLIVDKPMRTQFPETQEFQKLPTVLQRLLLTEWTLVSYLTNLFFDFGLMSGTGAHEFFENAIAHKVRRGKDFLGYSLTFDEFFRIQNKEFKIYLTGTNLETGSSQYFSVETTPYMRIADAVRISMSIPMLFKPVVIRPGYYKNDDLVGTWVDGGILNNNPIHAFDNDQGVVSSHVLGFRLGLDTARTIENIFSFLGSLMQTLLTPGELGQIRTPQEAQQTVVLPASGLSTTEFVAPPEVVQNAIRESAYATMEYFGLKQVSNSFLREFGVTQYKDIKPIIFQ